MNSLARRVSHYVDINATEFERLEELPHRVETRKPGEDIVSIGETIDYIFVIESGWALRSRILDDGRRQILNFMLPGDCFDLMSLVSAKADHTVSAATEVKLRRIGTRDFFKEIYKNQQLATAFWWVAVQEEAILREQIIRVGRRSAVERVAHMLLELNRRLAMIEGKEKDFIDLPVPQSLLADALGLSVVHVSRTFTKLKREGMIATTPQGIEILERQKLKDISDFESAYLHLERLKFEL